MIYNKSGSALQTVYNKSGSALLSAYDKSGNLVFPASSNTIKVMTYNVGQWYIGGGSAVPTDKKTEYYNLQYNTFSNNAVDILFLQEYLGDWCVDGSPASELLSPFFDDQEVTTPQGYIGHSICTKNHAMANYTSHAFTSHGGNYPSFESCEITIGGKTVTLINTHNDYSAAYQQPEITDLLSFVSNLTYFILCGDFNIDLSEESTTGSQYRINVKPFLDAGYHVANCSLSWIPTYFSTASPTGGKFTDQIVTSPNITITNLQAYTAKLTDGINDKIDHIPLMADLVIS